MSKKDTSLRIRKKFSAFWRRNPVLSKGLALVPVIAGSSTLKNALAITLMMVIILIPTYLFASFTKLNKPKYIRIPIYALVSALFYIPAVIIVYSIFTVTVKETIGIYLYLTAVDIMVIYRADEFARRVKPSKALVDAVCNLIGFIVIIIPVALFREFIGFGSINGVKIMDFSISAVRLPLFGFIIIGLFSALFNIINRKYDIHRAEEELIRKFENGLIDEDGNEIVDISNIKSNSKIKKIRKINKNI